MSRSSLTYPFVFVFCMRLFVRALLDGVLDCDLLLDNLQCLEVNQEKSQKHVKSRIHPNVFTFILPIQPLNSIKNNSNLAYCSLSYLVFTFSRPLRDSSVDFRTLSCSNCRFHFLEPYRCSFRGRGCSSACAPPPKYTSLLFPATAILSVTTLSTTLFL